MNRLERVVPLVALAIATLFVAVTPAIGQGPIKQIPPRTNLQPPPVIRARLDLSTSMPPAFSTQNSTQNATAQIAVSGLKVNVSGTGIQLIPGGTVRVWVVLPNSALFPKGSYSLAVGVRDYASAASIPASDVITIQQVSSPQVNATCPVMAANSASSGCALLVPIPAGGGRVSQEFLVTTNRPVGILFDWVNIY